MNSTPTTNNSGLTPAAARLVLGLFIATTLFFVAITISPLRSGYADAPSRGPGDAELYWAEAARVHAGQSYYQAANVELRERGYPTRSIFNWRMPLPVWLIGILPDPALGQAVLGGLSLALIVLAFGLMSDEGSLREGILAVLLLSGAILPILLGHLFVMPELWSGVCIALSVAAYGAGRRKLGVASGFAALVLRELAAPYCLVCGLMALYERRWREVAVWASGLFVYIGYLAFHIAQVRPLIGVDDVAHAQGWVQFGGAGFVISTVQMNAYLLLLPQWVTAIYFALALLGFALWNSEAGQRAGITVALFVIAFSFVGQSFNQYWGSMIAPLMCLGVARSLGTLKGLWKAARHVPRACSSAA